MDEIVAKIKEYLKIINNNIEKFGFNWTMGYHGVGDVGGAPKEGSVKTVCDEIRTNDSKGGPSP